MFRLLWIALLVCVADQATKYLALKYLVHSEIAIAPFLNLSLAFNTGAAFSFLSGAGGWQNLFFVLVAFVVCVVILFMIRRLGANDTQVAAALMLVLGGAAGNVIDRLQLGYVVDFIDVYYRSWHWPTFNLADSAITLGAILLILDAFGISLGRRSEPSAR
jgi:signal peptidase II